MLIPTEILFSGIAGGIFETEGSRGWWWKGGKLVASWRRDRKTKRVVVTWNT